MITMSLSLTMSIMIMLVVAGFVLTMVPTQVQQQSPHLSGQLAGWRSNSLHGMSVSIQMLNASCLVFLDVNGGC